MSDKEAKTSKPLILFFLLSYLLVFLPVSLAILDNYDLAEINLPFIPFLVVGSWTPNIAAIIIIAFVMKKRGGVKDLFSRWGVWKAPLRWYLAALSPLLVSALSLFLYLIIEGKPLEIAEAPTLPMIFGFLMISLITGAMGEELGWRGFALPWLQTKVNALWSSLIVGFLWGLWHLPLWFAGLGWEEYSFWLFTYNCIALSVIMTWICNNTKGNMVLITIIHLFYNYSWNMMSMIWNVPGNKSMLYQAIILTAYVLIVIIATNPTKLSRRDSIPVNHVDKTWVK